MRQHKNSGRRQAETAADMFFLSRMALGKVPLPVDIVIDPVNGCGLKCPLCPSGAGKLNYKTSAMSLKAFRGILKKFPRIDNLYLFNWGEPFLNPDLVPMIRHAAKTGIRVVVHSNFNIIKNGAFFSRLAGSGLDTLVLSIDGCSQETYSKYRAGGDLATVLANIKTLVRAKERLGADKPKIIWKFLINRHNEAEIKKAQDAAEALKISFTTGDFNLGDDIPDCDFEPGISQRKASWLPRDAEHIPERYRGRYKLPLSDRPCHSLFKTICVNPDGRVFPCCFASDKKNTFGDLTNQSLEEIWYNDKYRMARSLFTGEKFSGPETETVCDRCGNFLKFGA